MRKALFLVALLVIAWAATIVPLPLLQLAPLPAEPVTSVVEVATTQDEVSGELLYTVVAVAPVTAVGGVDAWIDPYRELELQQHVVPPDIDRGRFLEVQQRVFSESLHVAAAVGQRLAGREVAVSGNGARVVAIVPGAPAEDELETGDVIVAIDGEPVELASELVNALSRREAGDEVTLTVERGGQRLDVTVTLELLARTERAGLGVLVQTVDERISVPVEVDVSTDVAIGGPSAGLMMALTVYDLLDPADLTDGRRIAGTGTVDLSGNVGPIGGIVEKVRGAQLSDADVFLAPASQAEEAESAAPPGLEVIGVETAQGAIDALSENGG